MEFISLDQDREIAVITLSRGKSAQTFKSVKGLCRKPIVEEMLKREKDSIREFIEIRYSAETWKNLREIKIHS